MFPIIFFLIIYESISLHFVPTDDVCLIISMGIVPHFPADNCGTQLCLILTCNKDHGSLLMIFYLSEKYNGCIQKNIWVSLWENMVDN